MENLKQLLNGKDKLKEDLAMYILKTGIFDELLKTKRHSAQQIVLMKLDEKIFSFTAIDFINFLEDT